jgi:hypothetical protein
MYRQLIAAIALAGAAHADDAITQTADESDDAIPDQSLGASIGLHGGGNLTPGGLRIAGHYLYQLSEQDWFEGSVGFTFGAGGAECFRDRMDYVICDHGFLDGRGMEVTAAVRRYFAKQGQFVPFARAGVGISVVRFGDDDVTGVALPLHAGGGVRAGVADGVAVIAQTELVAGIGRFNRGMGTEPQLGIAILAGAERRLP